MSSLNEDERESIQHTDLSYEQEKKVRISYTRDFLLSLSELDVCKRLPSGFDQSLLSEFEDTSQDRYRIPGSLSSQSYRRTEYGSSPPTRGDAYSFSRSNQGRWDSRSSGKSDRDSDSQSDRDSDSGRRFANQARKPWQGTEHDGLLGSGSFPRPSGYSGSSALKYRANQPYQLNRSNEPYHPPRPYKAVPHLRRDTNDSFNDETFGSSDCTDEDRAEEERKRRASFELMRKEQQKAFQERQKSNPAKLKDEFDITELLEDSEDNKRLPTRINESVETPIQPISNEDSKKTSFSTPASVSRPLVPPGFSGTMVEKSMGTKLSLVVGSESEDSLLHVKGSHVVNGAINSQEQQQHFGQMDRNEEQLIFPINLPDSNESERNIPLSAAMDVPSKTIGSDSHVHKSPKFVEAIEASIIGKDIELDIGDGIGNKLMDLSGRTQSTSILEKLFGNASTINGGGTSSLVEDNDVKTEDSLRPHSPQIGQSSKFARWFLEEEKMPIEDVSSTEPNDLLSLIVGSEIARTEDVDVKATGNIQFSFPFKNSELSESSQNHMTTDLKSSNVELTEELLKTNKSEAVPAVLTCEDLEQSILSGLGENSSALPPPAEKWSGSELNKSNIDDHASKHLLSLLKSGAGPNYMAPSTNLANTSLDKRLSNEVASTPVQNLRAPHTEIASNSGKPLTLETLFGSAFMKELQSVGAASSGQKGAVESARADVLKSHDLPFSILEEGLLSSAVETSSSTENHEPNILAHDMTSQNELLSKLRGFDRSVDVHLPEENSLISVGDSLEHQNLFPATQETTIDMTEKLAALNSVFRDGRPPLGGQEDSRFFHGPYDSRNADIRGQNIHIQSSSSQLQAPHLNQVTSMFHPLDSHSANINPHMKVMAPENIFHNEIPNHQIFPNMLRPTLDHPNDGVTGFEHTIRDPMFQQMHMPGNFPPTHLLHGFPRGMQPPPLHTNNPMTGYVQNPNPIQGFPFDQSQPNIRSLGFPPQGVDLGARANNPEALQRLFEMEFRANGKQVHPSHLSAHGAQGPFSHELGMGFGYR